LSQYVGYGGGLLQLGLLELDVLETALVVVVDPPTTSALTLRPPAELEVPVALVVADVVPPGVAEVEVTIVRCEVD
jgi:hypothetical protein